MNTDSSNNINKTAIEHHLLSIYCSKKCSIFYLNSDRIYQQVFFFLIAILVHLAFCLFVLIFIFIFGCVGFSFLCVGFLQLWQAGSALHRGAWASHYRGLSCCGAQAPDAQAQQLWFMGLVAPRHVGSSQTRARTHVPELAGRFSTTAPRGKPLNRYF